MKRRLFAFFLAMVMLSGSMPPAAFATEAGGDAAPTTEATSAPTTEATSAPTTEATSAPTTEATSAPTTEATSAPTTEATSAPTTEATSAPTTEATSAPTTEATSAPTTEATSAPSTESTTEITTESTGETSSETTTEETETQAPSVPIDTRISLGSHTLHITAAEGVIPGGAAIQATLHQSFEIGDILMNAVSNLELFTAFDIQVAGEDGTALQPDGTVYVEIHTPDSLYGMEGATVRVYYVNIAERTATEIPCLVDFETGMVSFATDHFSVYAITVSDVPECICEDQCAAEAPNTQCPVCSRDASCCWGSPAVLSIEELAALFAALPHCSTVTFETPEEQKTAIAAQLEEAMNAYYTLMDADFETCSLFEEQYEDLIRNAQLLNDALTGNNWVPYNTYYDVGYEANGDNVTIVLSSEMADELPHVVRYIDGTPRVYQVVKLTNAERTYAFTVDSAYTSYTVTGATLEGANYQQSVNGWNSSVTLTPISTGSETADFKLFYLFSNEMAQPYYADMGRADQYGPSGDDIPFVVVTVKTADLRKSPHVTFGKNGYAIQWYFTPNVDETGKVTLENAQNFWKAVLSSMNESSLEAYNNTGLADEFVGYILKYESTWSGSYYHGDGILYKEDVSYVAELHETQGAGTAYFGSVVGSDKRYADVLDLCDQNLGGEVIWDIIEPYGTSVGYFYKTENNVQTTIKVTVTQTDLTTDYAQPSGSDIRYVRQSGGYYLAKYVMATAVSTKTTVSVTYTDGGENVFADITYPYVKEEAQNFPAFPYSTDREGYAFKGWKSSTDNLIYEDVSELVIPDGVSSITLTAQWDPITYTVLWKDKDGTVLETDTAVAYGSAPTYDRALPGTKVQTGYDEVFSGWTPAVTTVSGDPSVPIVYTAAYIQVPHQYNIVWKNHDGTVLETDQDVNYGTTPVYNGATPQRTEDAQYTYQFSGWSPAVSPVTGYQEYVAQYTKITKTYTVTWVDDNGKVLKTDLHVPYGTTPSYGTAPTRAETAEFTYTFQGWSPEIAIVTGDATYRAVYAENRRSYTVTWKNGDTVLETDTVEYGAMPQYDGAEPTKAADTQYSYVFDKWSPGVAAVTGDAEYVAAFTQVVNKYTVTWNYHGTQKQEIDRDVPYGTAPSFGDWNNLNYESANYKFTFSGWKLDGSDTLYKDQNEIGKLTVTGDMTLTAQYNAVRKGHDVTVRVIVDPVLENGNLVSGTQMRLADVLGAEEKLYLKGMGTLTYELVYNSTTMDYVATLVPDGEYKIYLESDDVTPVSSNGILVSGMNNSRNLYYYSVTYDPDGGSMTGDTVSYHRGSVTVTSQVPAKAGSTFLGWQVEGTDRILKAGETLTANIQQPYRLTALWGNARVDVQVTVKHAVYKANGELLGTDQHPGDVQIRLVYRDAQNPNEDYVEVVGSQKTYSAHTTGTDAAPYISTISCTDVYTGLDNRHTYSAVAILSGYTVESRTVTKAEGTDNHYIVQIVLQYNPKMFNLRYDVEADSAMEKDMIPSAVDVKLVYLHDGKWDTIAAHDHYSVDVDIKDTKEGESYPRFGSGTYPAPVFDADGNTRYYRVAAVGFSFGEGSGAVEMTATGDTKEDMWVFTSNAVPGQYSQGAYTATLTFQAENPEHQGAHGTQTAADSGIYAQHGELKLLVKAHPTTLKLKYNDGTQNTYQTIENLFVVPDLSSYVPTRDGYSFLGWYKEAGCTNKANGGDALNLSEGAENVLYAKWSADITVAGKVTVPNTFVLNGVTHKLYDHDLLSHVTVRVLDNMGRMVKAKTAAITYPKGADGKVDGYGTVDYEIKGIPNDGTAYTVDILQSTASYYSARYQNEVNAQGQVDNLSLEQAGDYTSYFEERNQAALGTVGPETATVNALLTFTPVNFQLNYTLDATAIGDGFRPDHASVVVFCDGDATNKFQWGVISQMIVNGAYQGQETPISAGTGKGEYSVWRNFGDGTLYNYAVGTHKIQYYPDGDGNAVIAEAGSDPAFLSTLPFTISYDPGYTYYSTSGEDPDQAQILKIVLAPRKYGITYVTNGGTMPETYPAVHTWSQTTVVRNAIPQRQGYTFAEWYEDADLNPNSGPVAMLDGSRRMETTLYAKWTADDFGITYTLNGGKDPGNPTSYNVETPTFGLKPPTREGYTFEGWTGTGLTDVTSDVVVAKGSMGPRSYTAHWERNHYAITVSVTNGSRTPSGSITVLHGEDQTIQFTPKSTSFTLDTVTVDGQPAKLDQNGSYTFENVTGSHTISVVYSEDSNQDGTPDNHQARVTYEVQNGTFAADDHNTQDNRFRVYFIDLKKKVDNVWVDITPVPTLGDTIPTLADGDMAPDAGYHSHGHWREPFDESMEAADGAHYLFHFNEPISYYIQYYPTGQMVNPLYTNGIFYGTGITVDPNGGEWTYTWENGKTETYKSAHNFPLDQNMHLGAASREHYVFCGWEHSTGSGEIAHVYTAKWKPVDYTITYHMPYGFLAEANPGSYTVETETFALNNPTRAGYTFLGWQLAGEDAPSTSVVIPKGSYADREYTAVWQANPATPYTVRYFFEVLNPGAGEPKFQENESMRLTATAQTDTQVSLSAEQMPEVPNYNINHGLCVTTGNVHGNGTLVLAVYYDLATYKVTWVNEGVPVQTDTVKHGQIPSYAGNPPIKTGDDQYSYTFTGWDKPIDQPVTADITFTAQYAQSTNSYTITWMDDGGEELDEKMFAYGTTPSYSGPEPAKASTDRYHYTFAGWTPQIVPVTADKTYTAVYTATDRVYTATVQFTVDGNNADTAQMEAILGTDQLYLGGIVDGTMTYTPLTAVENAAGCYTADVIVGTYHVYRGSVATKTPVSSKLLLTVVSTKPTQDTLVLPYHSVRYYDGHTTNGAPLKTEYLPEGSQVQVNYPNNPTRTQFDEELDKDVNWHFKGWQQGGSTELLHHGDSLIFTGGTSAGIQSAQTLTAQWSNVRVDVKVTVRHAYYEDGKYVGRDQDPGDLRINLAYRRDDTENFVEVVGSLKTYPGKTDNTNKDPYVSTISCTGAYVGLDDSLEYSANAVLNGYVLADKKVTKVNGRDDHLLVEIELQYNPSMFELKFWVEAQEDMLQSMIPSAVDVKLVYQSGAQWKHISAHANHSVDVKIDQTEENETYPRFGFDTYPVPAFHGDNTTRYYRTEAVGFTIGTGPDAVELNATGDVTGEPWVFSSSALDGLYSQGAYTATLIFEGNSDHVGDQHIGAHATQVGEVYQQDGYLKLVVKAHPTAVKLHLNYDTEKPVHGTIANVFVVPDLANQVPVRKGFSFLGWYYDPDCTEAAQTGGRLDLSKAENVLYAKWAEDFDVCVNIADITTVHSGLEDDPALSAVEIVLQKKGAVRSQVGEPVMVELTNGVGNHTFRGVPNDGSEYYIDVDLNRYEIAFHNEKSASGAFTPDARDAVDGEDEDTTATVDIQLKFVSRTFNLDYQVDASALGAAFRPASAPVLIMGDVDPSDGYSWKSLHEDGAELVLDTALTGGIGRGKHEVWQYNFNTLARIYAIRLQSLAVDVNGDGTPDTVTAGVDGSPAHATPFAVHYVYPAWYQDDGTELTQSQLLKATVTPKKSTITLVAAGGTLQLKDAQGNPVDGNTVEHIWSHPTDQSLSITREGYYFEGWADESGNILPKTLDSGDSNKAMLAASADTLRIGAAVYGNTRLTAVWTKRQTVNFRSGDRMVTYSGYDQRVDFAVYADLPAGYTFSGLSCHATGKNVHGDWQITFEEAADGIRIFNPQNVDETHLFIVGTKTYGKLTVYPAVLTVTAGDKTKTYDGETAEGFASTITGFLGSDSQDVVGGSVSYSVGPVEAIRPGSYTITPVVTELTADNYIFAPADGTLTIDKAPLTATLTADPKVYDGTDAVNGYTIDVQGRVGSDDVGITTTNIHFAGENVGVHTVTATDLLLEGTDSAFYDLQITQLQTQAGITPKPVTVWLSPVSRKYDGTTAVDIVFRTAEGILEKDQVSIINIAAKGKLVDGPDAGPARKVSVAYEPALSGMDSGNYTPVCQVDTVDILPRTVILATESSSKFYDGTPLTALGYSVGGDGFVDGEVSNLRTTGTVTGSDTAEKTVDNSITYDRSETYRDTNYKIIPYLGKLTVYPDKNGNGVSDTTEDTYTVMYLAKDTNLEHDEIYNDLLTGMEVPEPPQNVLAANDNGYTVTGWKLVGTGKPDAEGNIGTDSLIYEAVLEAKTFAITYDAAGGTMPETYPDSYTYGKGVAAFVTPTREKFVFTGWYLDDQTPITAITHEDYGSKSLTARWEEDKLTDGIPDIYQAEVIYKVENGTWADGTTEDIPCVYTLYEKGTDGSWTRLQNVTLGEHLPTGMKHGEGYDTTKPGSWSGNIHADTPVPVTGGTYTFTFGERRGYTLTISVLGGSAKVDGRDYEAPVTILHGDGAVAVFTEDEGLILDRAVAVTAGGIRDITLTDGSYTLENVTQDLTLQVRYSPDQWSDAQDSLTIPDGIPDTRQAVFQFRVSGTNGSLSGKTTQVFTLQRSQNGEYAENRAPESVTVTPANTYRLEKWVDINGTTVADPFASRLVLGGSQYVFTASFVQRYADVHYMDADKLESNAPQSDTRTILVDKGIRVDPNGGSWRGSTEVQDVIVTQDVTLETPSRQGYLFRGWKCEPGSGVQRSTVEITYTFTAQWLADGSGSTAGGDGIPDIYQKKVIFRIENGTWAASGIAGLLGGSSEDIVCYLPLTDAQGNWSQTGTAYLKPLIPTDMRAKWGYHNGKWDVTPPDHVSGTDTVVYTYRFTAKNLMNPKTGDDSAIHLWLMAMLAALAALAGLLILGRRKKHRQNF